MADLEQRVDKLEEKVAKLEISISASLGEIKSDLTEIKTFIENNNKSDDLKNELIRKDVAYNDTRIKKLEDIQAKVVWCIISSFIALVIEAVALYLRTK